MAENNEHLKIDRPIEGQIERSSRGRVEQRTAPEFLEMMDTVLAVPGIDAIRFTGYIPYFNDGDVCEYGTGEIEVKLSSEFNDGDLDNETFLDTYLLYTLNESEWKKDPRYNSFTTRWASREDYKTYSRNGKDTRAIADALAKIDLQPYYDVLQENFGDHSRITVTPEGFNVEFYEHD